MRREIAALACAGCVALLAGLGACASGGASDGPGDGSVEPVDGGLDGQDGTTSRDAPGSDGTSGEGGPSDGAGGDGAVTLSEACDDNASAYCAQLEMCAPFELSTIYGTVDACKTRQAYCSDIVSAKGSGWTASGLESCVKARTNLTCAKFLNERPAPAACSPTGTLKAAAACRYDSQCATGYCKLTAGSLCGTCTALGGGGATCTSSADCEASLMCATNGTCASPSGVGGTCDATTPCDLGLDCIGGSCAAPIAVGGACDGGVPCNASLGGYCSAMKCDEMSVVKPPAACGGTTNAACYGGAACLAGACAGPVDDGKACDGGVPCLSPSTCNAGKCGLYTASNCK